MAPPALPAPGIDRPGAVRPGEELPLDRLAAFLAIAVPGFEAPLEVRQYPRGYSNLTYLLRAGGREVVLRRPPAGSTVRTAHDMGREHRILAALHPALGTVPRPLAYCPDPAVIGAPFYVMERVRGVILRQEPPPGVALEPPRVRRLAESFADRLAALHALDPVALGLGDLGRPEGYVGRQVRGWTERYAAARTDDLPDLERAAARLAVTRPPESGACLVHNDFKYDNLVLDPNDLARVRAILDWEMATVGDPLLDLGTSLGYWVEAGDPEEIQRFRFGCTHLPGSLTRREVAARYAAARGLDPAALLAALPFYHAFGLFKIAVIAQQIYVRWQRGLTTDPRFGGLRAAIRALGARAWQVLEEEPAA